MFKRLKIKKGDPSGFIGKVQALSLNLETEFDRIVKILLRHDKMINAYIHKIGDSISYDMSNKLSGVLSAISKLSEEQIDELITIYKKNSQVFDSKGFNGKGSGEYGMGLKFELKRITGKEYNL